MNLLVCLITELVLLTTDNFRISQSMLCVTTLGGPQTKVIY